MLGYSMFAAWYSTFAACLLNVCYVITTHLQRGCSTFLVWLRNVCCLVALGLLLSCSRFSAWLRNVYILCIHTELSLLLNSIPLSIRNSKSIQKCIRQNISSSMLKKVFLTWSRMSILKNQIRCMTRVWKVEYKHSNMIPLLTSTLRKSTSTCSIRAVQNPCSIIELFSKYKYFIANLIFPLHVCFTESK